MESVIFSHQGVTVGYSHFKVGSKTYPIKDITSVESFMLKPKRLIARLFVFTGLPFILGRNLYPVLGLALMLIGLIRYALLVHTLAGDYKPLISEDSQDIDNVVSALNVALAMRGCA